jgi:hypothetical protein
MKATLRQAYTHPAGLAAANQDSMQMLADGRVLVGWGNLPYIWRVRRGRDAAAGRPVPGRGPVVPGLHRGRDGHPTDKPAVAARVNPAGGSVVYASWNGSTELDTWTVLAGTTAGALAKAGSQRRAGFETAITVNTKGPYFAAAAADASGHVLAQSATVRLEK